MGTQNWGDEGAAGKSGARNPDRDYTPPRPHPRYEPDTRERITMAATPRQRNPKPPPQQPPERPIQMTHEHVEARKQHPWRSKPGEPAPATIEPAPATATVELSDSAPELPTELQAKTGEARVWQILATSPDALTPWEIRDFTDMAYASVSASLTRLKARGLVGSAGRHWRAMTPEQRAATVKDSLKVAPCPEPVAEIDRAFQRRRFDPLPDHAGAVALLEVIARNLGHEGTEGAAAEVRRVTRWISDLHREGRTHG